jgi:hypothetical protein
MIPLTFDKNRRLKAFAYLENAIRQAEATLEYKNKYVGRTKSTLYYLRCAKSWMLEQQIKKVVNNRKKSRVKWNNDIQEY